MYANFKGEFALGIGSAYAQVLFGVFCWMLWKNKNDHVFNQRSDRVKDMIRAADCFVINVRVAYRVKKNIGVGIVEKIKWHSPTSGWLKVNSNGATSTDGGWSTVHEVLRDSYGN